MDRENVETQLQVPEGPSRSAPTSRGGRSEAGGDRGAVRPWAPGLRCLGPRLSRCKRRTSPRMSMIHPKRPFGLIERFGLDSPYEYKNEADTCVGERVLMFGMATAVSAGPPGATEIPDPDHPVYPADPYCSTDGGNNIVECVAPDPVWPTNTQECRWTGLDRDADGELRYQRGVLGVLPGVLQRDRFTVGHGVDDRGREHVFRDPGYVHAQPAQEGRRDTPAD